VFGPRVRRVWKVSGVSGNWHEGIPEVRNHRFLGGGKMFVAL